MSFTEPTPEDTVEYQLGFNKGMVYMLKVLIGEMGGDLDLIKQEFPSLEDAIDGFRMLNDNVEALQLQINEKYRVLASENRVFIDFDIDQFTEWFLEQSSEDSLSSQQATLLEFIAEFAEPKTAIKLTEHLTKGID